MDLRIAILSRQRCRSDRISSCSIAGQERSVTKVLLTWSRMLCATRPTTGDPDRPTTDVRQAKAQIAAGESSAGAVRTESRVARDSKSRRRTSANGLSANHIR